MHPLYGHHTISALSDRLNPHSGDLQSVYITAAAEIMVHMQLVKLGVDNL